MLEKYLDIKEEIKSAILKNEPIVALESTIISHGMPYPQNVETAIKIHKIVRESGAIPATIAIIDGKLKVGLTEEEIGFLGEAKNILKASRRDLPYIIANNLHGGTTVASTMIIADFAKIKVFATGGIGGVHRGAEKTFDISADLQELANTSVAVVCAGAKSILDLGLTLEYLETHGVPVLGYKTSELPAFYTRRSGFNVDYQVNSPLEIAKVIKIKSDLSLKGGMVIANPIPEEFSMDYDKVNSSIEEALKLANEKGIKGKETTPFLLSQIKKITKGKSLDSNIELVYNNAKLAAQIAFELSRLI